MIASGFVRLDGLSIEFDWSHQVVDFRPQLRIMFRL